MSETQRQKRIKFYIGTKERKVPHIESNVWSAFQKQYHMPQTFRAIISETINDDPYYPYLDVHAFDLFINLMITPSHLKIPNPHRLNEVDLEPIFETFAIKQGDKYEYSVGLLKSRLNQ